MKFGEEQALEKIMKNSTIVPKNSQKLLFGLVQSTKYDVKPSSISSLECP